MTSFERLSMFKTKLVEKEVEVTVTELRQIKEYEYDGKTFDKRELKDYLNRSLYYAGDEAMMEIGNRTCCLTAVRKVIPKMEASEYMKIYDTVKKYVELVRELEKDQ